MAELLSDQQKIGIVQDLVQAGTLTRQDAEIYLLREFGTATEPPYRYNKIKRHFKIGGTQAATALRRSRPIVDRAFAVSLQSMLRRVTTEGLTEDQTPLDFGITLQFGSRASTREDMTAKTALIGQQAA